MKNIVVVILLFSAFFKNVYAQYPPRIDDHFWRKKVLERIDLEEKLNKPLIYSETKIYTKGKYGETNGIIRALINGYKDGKYVGYQFGALTTPMTYQEFEAKMKGTSYAGGAGGDEEGGEDEEEFEDEEGEDSGSSAEQATTDGQQPTDTQGSQGSNNSQNSDILRYEKYLGIIEDRIFDKNKSDMYYDIQYICLINFEEVQGGDRKSVV